MKNHMVLSAMLVISSCASATEEKQPYR